jgi:hypothetical protein
MAGNTTKKRGASSSKLDTTRSCQRAFVTVAALTLLVSIHRQEPLSNLVETVKAAHNHVWKEKIQDNVTVVENAKWTAHLNHTVPTSKQGHFSSDENKSSMHSPGMITSTTVEKYSSLAQESERETKPWLILHIGPPKTGTTSIQCGLHQYSRQLKESDNYVYMGIKCPYVRNASQSWMPNNETSIRGTTLAYYMNGFINQTDEVYQIFHRLSQLREQGHNVIISSEHLFSVTSISGQGKKASWSQFKSLISGFNVKAVVVHRFLVDWLPSYYYQTFVSIKKGGIPSFQRYLETALKVMESKAGKKPYRDLDVLSKLEVWSHHFDLDVMDFYRETKEEDLVQHFICHHIPDANKTCQLLNNEKKELIKNSDKRDKVTSHVRVSASLQPLRSYFYAIEKYGEYQNTSAILEDESVYQHFKNESTSVKYLPRYLENAGKVFEERDLLSNPYYLDCISPGLEAKLKNYSTIVMQAFHEKRHGRPMTQKELVNGIEKQHEVFEKNRVGGKYCDLNLDRVFLNDTIASALIDF